MADMSLKDITTSDLRRLCDNTTATVRLWLCHLSTFLKPFGYCYEGRPNWDGLQIFLITQLESR